MFKRTLCVILSLSISLSLSSISFAKQGENIDVVYGTNELSTKEYSVQTPFDGIVTSQDGFYAMKTQLSNNLNTVDIPVGRLDIDLSNDNEIETVLNRSDIPQEVKAEIKNKHISAKENNCSTATMSYFSSGLLSDDEETTYYTYKGHRMRNDKLFTYGLSTGWEYIEEGYDTLDTSENITDIVLTSVGVANVYVGILSTGMSLFEAFVDEWGQDFATGHSSDYAQIRLIYDDIDQWTYAEIDGEWSIGLISGCITVTKIGTEQYYYNINDRTGETTTTDEYVNVEYESENFSYPWPAAWQWAGNPEDETIEWEAGDKIFSF